MTEGSSVPAINPKRTVYVGGLDDEITEELLRAAFIPFGDLTAISIPTDSHNRTRGFAFVEFENMEDAMAAMDNMNKSELLGKVITCSIAKPTATSTRIKPVWEDEEYMKSIQEQYKEKEKNKEDEEHDEAGVMVSNVVVNAPKRRKVEEAAPKLPPGFVRCKDCGGWGKGLVKEHGYCNHCWRKQRGATS